MIKNWRKITHKGRNAIDNTQKNRKYAANEQKKQMTKKEGGKNVAMA